MLKDTVSASPRISGPLTALAMERNCSLAVWTLKVPDVSWEGIQTKDSSGETASLVAERIPD